MDRANEAVAQASRTPKTDVAKFTITARDVGTEAVRPGHMAELEEQRQALLLAAQIVLQRGRRGQSKLDSVSEHVLETAIKVAGASS